MPSDLHIIEWKSKTTNWTGRAMLGQSKEKTEQLARDLDQDYPDVAHKAVPGDSTTISLE